MCKNVWKAPPLMAMLFLSTSLGAQGIPDPPNAFNTFQINFSDPGARSMGMGGAFVAVADDATAAFANPAGLIQLIRPEISAEVRQWSFTTPFIAGGTISFAAPPETTIRESTESVSDLSFLSFVYPRDRWSLAIYRHQFLNFQGSAETQDFFVQLPTGISQIPDIRSFLDIDIVTHGISAGYRATEELSLGFGVSHFSGDSLSGLDIYNPFAPSSFQPEDLIRTNVLDSTDSDWGINAGILWRFLDRWFLGASFRQGPKLDIQVDSVSGPFMGVSDLLIWRYSGKIKFPDVYGLGFAFRSTKERLHVSFEWDYVEYAKILESASRGTCAVGSCPDLFSRDTHEAEDGSEFHAGVEYAFRGDKPRLLFRVGAWLDPDHRLRSTSPDPVVRAFFQEGEDELHYTAGFGVTFGAYPKQIEIDLGIDVSDLVDTIGLSAIYRF